MSFTRKRSIELAPGLYLVPAEVGYALMEESALMPTTGINDPPSTDRASSLPVSDFQAGYLHALAELRPTKRPA